MVEVDDEPGEGVARLGESVDFVGSGDAEFGRLDLFVFGDEEGQVREPVFVYGPGDEGGEVGEFFVDGAAGDGPRLDFALGRLPEVFAAVFHVGDEVPFDELGDADLAEVGHEAQVCAAHVSDGAGCGFDAVVPEPFGVDVDDFGVGGDGFVFCAADPGGYGNGVGLVHVFDDLHDALAFATLGVYVDDPLPGDDFAGVLVFVGSYAHGMVMSLRMGQRMTPARDAAHFARWNRRQSEGRSMIRAAAGVLPVWQA